MPGRGRRRRAQRVIIVGASRIGVELAKAIEMRVERLVLIETDAAAAEEAASELKKTTVLFGDGTDLEVLADFGQRLDYDTVAFNATDGDGIPVYHTNVMMSVGSDFAVVCEDAIGAAGETPRAMQPTFADQRRVGRRQALKLAQQPIAAATAAGRLAPAALAELSLRYLGVRPRGTKSVKFAEESPQPGTDELYRDVLV